MGPGRTAALMLAVVLATAPSTATADDEAEQRELDEQYARLIARGKRQYLRAFLEESAIMAGSAAWYWIDRDRQVADWDFPSFEARFTGAAWRYDNNSFPINYAWHPFNGGAFHVVARANELSLPVAVGYGLATSMAWEWILEFRENVSVNDVISTSIAGTALGEFVHWFGRYTESAPVKRSWHPYVQWFPNLPRGFHHALDGTRSVRAGTTPDSLGFSSDIWHRFSLGTRVSRAEMSGDATGDALTIGELHVVGELAAIPGFLTARRMRRWFVDGNISALDLRIAAGPDASALDWRSEAILVGWHGQHVPANGVGNATTVGAAVGYRYRRELFADWRERQGLTHLPGLAIDHHVVKDDVMVRARARGHVDFVGVHAEAWPRWRAAHPDEVTKKILTTHGYYYGWGVSGRLELEVATPRVSAGGVVEYARYGSDEGLDRFQEDLTIDVEANDTILEWETWLRVRPTRGRVFVEGRVTHQDRDGNVGEFESSQALRRYFVELGVAL